MESVEKVALYSYNLASIQWSPSSPCLELYLAAVFEQYGKPIPSSVLLQT